jgi:hypothetical protein
MAITLLSDVQRMELPFPTPLIGRWRELDAVTALLRKPDVRVVTLCVARARLRSMGAGAQRSRVAGPPRARLGRTRFSACLTSERLLRFIGSMKKSSSNRHHYVVGDRPGFRAPEAPPEISNAQAAGKLARYMQIYASLAKCAISRSLKMASWHRSARNSAMRY